MRGGVHRWRVSERARTQTDWGPPPGANFSLAGGDTEGKASSFHTSVTTEGPWGKGGGILSHWQCYASADTHTHIHTPQTHSAKGIVG